MLKAAGHEGHAYGFSPVCVRMCLTSAAWLDSVFWQTWHFRGHRHGIATLSDAIIVDRDSVRVSSSAVSSLYIPSRVKRTQLILAERLGGGTAALGPWYLEFFILRLVHHTERML